MIIFALEFIWQSLNIDQIHFVSKMLPTFFKLNVEVWPFLVYIRATNHEIKEMLKDMKSPKGEI